jgi:hypothetical protein
MRRIAIVITALNLLAGCDVADLPPSSIAPICRALVGPIKYNTKNVMSQRYAAYLLSLDIHARNEIGRKLNCPKYK